MQSEVVLNIQFVTNKKVCAINIAEFTLKNGTKLTIDRKRTEYRIVQDKNTGEYCVNMDWYECYLWAINDYHIFRSEEAQLFDAEEINRLLQEAVMEIIPEDDVADYYVDDVSWRID